MNRPQHPTASRRPVEFKLPSFEEDKRLAFVDSVCATLMTSRFGSGATYILIPRFEGTTADEPFSFLDLMEEESVGWHDAEFLGRASSGSALRKPARSKGIALADISQRENDTTSDTINRTNKSPATLGRGSPKIPGTFSLASSFCELCELCVRKSHFRQSPQKNAKKA